MKAIVAHGTYQLYLITNPAEREAEYRRVVSGKPVSYAAFDLYYDADRLYYAKEPCARVRPGGHDGGGFSGAGSRQCGGRAQAEPAARVRQRRLPFCPVRRAV